MGYHVPVLPYSPMAWKVEFLERKAVIKESLYELKQLQERLSSHAAIKHALSDDLNKTYSFLQTVNGDLIRNIKKQYRLFPELFATLDQETQAGSLDCRECVQEFKLRHISVLSEYKVLSELWLAIYNRGVRLEESAS
jgi:hypothetical protein